MGIRFRCHHCEHELHVKDFQAGKRGKCPKCTGRFRVPPQSTDFSLAVEEPVTAGATLNSSFEHEAASSGPAASPAATAPTSNAIEDVSESTEAPLDALAGASSRAESTDAPSASTPAQVAGEGDLPEEQGTASEELASASSTGLWYVRPPSGGQFGPASQEVFDQWLAENRVTADSLVWCEGWPEWKVASDALADHFQSDVVDLQLAPQPHAQAAVVPAAPFPSPDHGAVKQPSLGERNRMQRKQRRRRNYVLMIIGLSVLAVCC